MFIKAWSIPCYSFVGLYPAVLKENQSVWLLTLRYFASLMAVLKGKQEMF